MKVVKNLTNPFKSDYERLFRKMIYYFHRHIFIFNGKFDDERKRKSNGPNDASPKLSRCP